MKLDEYEKEQERIRLMIDSEPIHVCEMCGDDDLEMNMIYLESEDIWFHDDCALLCNVTACDECGEIIDWEKQDKCFCGREK